MKQFLRKNEHLSVKFTEFAIFMGKKYLRTCAEDFLDIVDFRFVSVKIS
jgi:hypothetical protein